MANRFWVGGTGTWDGTAGTKWASTSGGLGGASVPTAADDVFIDNLSGTGTVTTSVSSVCRSLDTNGFTGTFSVASGNTLSIGDGTAGVGNRALRFGSGTTVTNGGTTSTITFVSTSSTVQSITTSGKSVPRFTFNGAGGRWQFQDAVTNTDVATVTAGEVDCANYTWTALRWASSVTGTRSILNIGTFASSGTGGITVLDFTTSTNLTLGATNANLTIAGSGSSKTIQLGGLTWGTITYTANNAAGPLQFSTSGGRVNKLVAYDNTVSRDIRIGSSNWDIRDWSEVYGIGANNVLIRSTSIGSIRFLKIGSPTIQTVDRATISDIYIFAPNKFYATNSTNAGNVRNVTFGAAGSTPYLRQSVVGTQATGTSNNINLDHTATAGNLLVATLGFSGNPGTITPPSGWLLAHEHSRSTSTYVDVFYKVANGTETTSNFSWVNSVTANQNVDEWYNFTGTPTLDTISQNDSASATSLNSGSATNSTAPALTVTAVAGNGGLGVSTANPTNGFGGYWNSQMETSGGIFKTAAETQTTTGSQDTTFAWTTSRVPVAVIVNFIGVQTNSGNFFLMF